VSSTVHTLRISTHQASFSIWQMLMISESTEQMLDFVLGCLPSEVNTFTLCPLSGLTSKGLLCASFSQSSVPTHLTKRLSWWNPWLRKKRVTEVRCRGWSCSYCPRMSSWCSGRECKQSCLYLGEFIPFHAAWSQPKPTFYSGIQKLEVQIYSCAFVASPFRPT
jgi:hypothetical protein